MVENGKEHKEVSRDLTKVSLKKERKMTRFSGQLL